MEENNVRDWSRIFNRRRKRSSTPLVRVPCGGCRVPELWSSRPFAMNLRQEANCNTHPLDTTATLSIATAKREGGGLCFWVPDAC